MIEIDVVKEDEEPNEIRELGLPELEWVNDLLACESGELRLVRGPEGLLNLEVIEHETFEKILELDDLGVPRELNLFG